MTRDSEYSLNDEIDESYVDKMSESMKQRLIDEPVRVAGSYTQLTLPTTPSVYIQ